MYLGHEGEAYFVHEKLFLDTDNLNDSEEDSAKSVDSDQEKSVFVCVKYRYQMGKYLKMIFISNHQPKGIFMEINKKQCKLLGMG